MDEGDEMVLLESQGVVSCVRRGDAGRELGGVVRGEAEGGMGMGVDERW